MFSSKLISRLAKSFYSPHKIKQLLKNFVRRFKLILVIFLITYLIYKAKK
jgi:hypothetical protein